jgi:nitrite reductase/ring-hydroxylating ferredoxin subunit/uncharacterized membrane protein
MLIPFPLAFLIGGFVADSAGWAFDHPDLPLVGYYLIAAGILMGLLAAVPGLIDYLKTVPPNSSGKKRATKHLAVNVSALTLFALAWYLRGGPGVQPEPVLLAFEAAGAALLAVGGWMGGVLAFRNQIGVDHRYAEAGKWSESRVQRPQQGPVTVARDDELQVDQMKLLHVDGERIVLARTEEGWVAFSDSCTHRGGSLAGGVMTCGTVICPWHGSQFDVRSGAVSAGPAGDRIRTFPVTVEGGQVRLDAHG